MKKLYYLLLLSLFTSFILMSNDQENKNKVLAQQLSTINTQFQKWKKELEGYKKWALENDGVLSAEEQAEIDRRQKDMDAILARVAQIVKAKGLLALMGLPTKEETKATAEIEEKEILPTETTLERPDPLKSVAALDNEEAMGMLGSLNPEVTVQDDHIPKSAFIQKAKNVLISLTNFKLNDSYELDTAIVISLLKNVNLTTPLGNEIKQTIISKIPAGKTSVSAINSIIVDIASYWNDKDRLGEHYQKNEAAYSAKESTGTVKELEVADLETDKNRIKAFLNNLKEYHKEAEYKKEKAEEEKKKLEEEKKKEIEAKKKEIEAAIVEFKLAYVAWLEKTKAIIANLISADAGTESLNSIPKAIIIKDLLFISQEWTKIQPELTEEIRTRIVSELKSDTIKVREIVGAMRNALLNLNTNEVYIFVAWQKNRRFPDFNDLKSTITTSAAKVNENELFKQYIVWFQKVGGVLDTLAKEKPLLYTQRFKKASLLTDLKKMFGNSSYTAFIYPVLEEKINAINKELPTLEDLDRVWKGALYEVVVTSNKLSTYFANIEKEAKDTSELEKIVKSIGASLEAIASADTIKETFYRNRYIPAPLPSLAKGESIMFDLTLDDGTILTNTILTQISRSTGNLEFVNPINASVVASAGKRGYTFSNAIDFVPQSPLFNGKTATIALEYKIPFTKNKGAITLGHEVTEETTTEITLEHSVTDVYMKSFNLSNELTFEAKAKLKALWGAVDFGEGTVSNSTNIGWGWEWGTETTNGISLMAGYTEGSSSSISGTDEKGEDSGFFLVQLILVSEKVGDNQLEVEAVIKEVSSPNAKDFKLKPFKNVRKTMTWKED